MLQIEGGKLRPTVTEGRHVGESSAALDQYGAVEMQEVTSRFAPMNRVDMAVDRRWVYPVDFDLPQMVDTFDKARLLTDPMSDYTIGAVKAHRRQTDTVLFDAFYADAKTGKAGGTTTAFDTTNHRVDAAVGAAGDTGLNVDKILKAKQLLQEANVDLEDEEVYLAITPQQENDLLGQTQVINADYFTKNSMPVLATDGRVTAFAGCKIICSNLVQQNAAATYRLNPMWVKSGMYLGVWNDVSTRVDARPDLRGVPTQLYSLMTIGATRLEEGRVIQIENTEA
ncbi:MAG: hypothetical protein GY767_07950 [Shimia sp.]|nr:hypothetical protein [Shimia sp.]